MSAGAAPEPSRPVLLAVDDDPEVLRAVERDLRQRYGRDHRVVSASSGGSALETLRELKLRGTEVAVVVADQRMPGITGVELLGQVRDLLPRTKRVLLTAYADTQAAIAGINEVGLDHYILKPWDPPEERLYPVIDDLLDEWRATAPRGAAAIRLVGDRWSAESHHLREFLARNLVPFEWLDVDGSDEATRLLAAAGDDVRPPLLVLEDGRALSAPDLPAVADALGLHARPDADFFDLLVVGAGPAGLAAAVYGASEGLRTGLVEREGPGGQAGLSSRIENYLGFPNGVAGAELARRAITQARRFGAELISPRLVERLERSDPYRIARCDDGSTISCSAVIVATGVQYRALDADGAERLVGAGVYYGAASTEAPAMKGGRAVVVGGANSAGQATVHLAQFAEQVTVVVRAASLEARMSSYLVEQIRALDNVEVRLRASVTRVSGDSRVTGVTIRDADGNEDELEALGVFVFIGALPQTDWLEGAVHRDEHGFIVTGPPLRERGRWGLERDPYLLETSMPGVFAVGDVRARSVKRVASAVGEGATAVQLVHEYLRGGTSG